MKILYNLLCARAATVWVEPLTLVAEALLVMRLSVQSCALARRARNLLTSRAAGDMRALVGLCSYVEVVRHGFMDASNMT